MYIKLNVMFNVNLDIISYNQVFYTDNQINSFKLFYALFLIFRYFYFEKKIKLYFNQKKKNWLVYLN